MRAQIRARIAVAALIALLAIPLVPASVAWAAVPTVTTVGSSLNPSTYGEAVTFTAEVSSGAGTPTGDVQFRVDGSPLGSPVTLVAGAATSIPVSSLAAGTHAVTAEYTSDDPGSFDNSTGTLAGDQVVDKAPQAPLIFSPVSPAVFGSSQMLTATGGSGTGAVTYSVGVSTACSVSGDQLTITAGTGTCSVTATKAADDNYLVRTSAPASVTVQRATQTVSFSTSAPANARVGGPTYTPGAVAEPSGLTVTVSRASGSSGVCSISGGGVVSFIGAGTCTLHADQAGDADYEPASQATQEFAVSAADPTTTAVASSVNPSTYGDSVTFTATITAGVGTPTGTVQFKVDGVNLGGPATVSAGVATSIATSTLTATTHAVTAIFTSNDSVNFGDSSGTLSGGQVVQKADQATLTVTGPASATFGAADATITTSGGSGGGAETFSAGGSTACSIVAGKLHVLSGTGTCSVTATKAADGNYNATTSAPFSVTVQKADQATLTVTGPATKTYGDIPFAPATTGGSGTGGLTFTSSTPSICTASASASVTIVAAGTCTVTATKAADSNYNVETSAPFSVTVDKADQATLTVTGPASATFGAADATITTSGGSGGGAETFSAGGSTACSIVAGKLHVLSGTGTCSVTATKAADGNYNATTSAPFSVTVQKADQAALTVTGPATKTYGDIPFAPATSGGSGTGGLTFTSSTPSICTASASASVTIVAAGTCTVTATKAADSNYNVDDLGPLLGHG